MGRYDDLASHLDKVDEGKKGFILSLLKDFVFYEEKINELRKYPQYIINPKDNTKQIKLPVHDILKDFQSQKNDIAVKILRTIDGESPEVSALAKALAEYK